MKMYLRSSLEKLKNRKKELGWTNQKLSEESGIPVGTLNKIFNGTTRYPRDRTVESLMEALGLNEAELEDFPAGFPIFRESGIYHPGYRKHRATLATYYSLPEELRAELIDGKLYYLPAPTLRHQALLTVLTAELCRYFSGRKERFLVFGGGCDVCLDGDEYTMLKPDIFVIRGEEKVSGGICCEGAPEFVMEIVSGADSKHDYELKRYKYQSAGVKEYWIADPIRKRIVVYVFARDAVPGVHTFGDRIRSWLYPDLEIDFDRIRKEMI